MDMNLSWTSVLGDAYANQPQEILAAVQSMRTRAQQAGNLKSTSEETVATVGDSIVIEPADAEVVYVPEYDPWLVYGAPLGVFPGWVPFPGLFAGGSAVSFGLGLGIGIFAGFGWGWHHWGADWHGRTVAYNHNAYDAHSRSFADGNAFYHGYANFAHIGGLHGGATSPAQFGVHAGTFQGRASFGRNYAGSFHSGGFTGGGFTGGGFAGGGFTGGGLHDGGFHIGGFHGGGLPSGGFHGGGGHR